MSNEDKTVIAEISQIDLKPHRQKKSVASLVQYSGSALGKRYMLAGEKLTIGRSVDADITIGEASVSRIHARIIQQNENIIIEDAGSANGTYINDQKVIGRMSLNDQDMLRLGTVLLKFFSSDNIDGFIQDKIYRMATIDAGTQIYNKQYLLDSLTSEFQSSISSGRKMSIIYYDLDHFKRVNDTYGHNAGDQILRESSHLVKKLIRKDDILGRFGGEEFIIILPNTDSKTAYELGERVRSACANHIYKLEVVSGGKKQLVQHQQTFSVGISQISSKMRTPKDLLESADKKLYASKQSGRNKVTV
ncbi:MAG: diguanylate cyclase [Oligoflexales bacterium]